MDTLTEEPTICMGLVKKKKKSLTKIESAPRLRIEQLIFWRIEWAHQGFHMRIFNPSSTV
jgi:hypothetical protein